MVFWVGKSGDVALARSGLSDEFRAQNEPLDGLVPAIDLLLVPCQPDGPDHRSTLQRLVGAFYRIHPVSVALAG